MATDPPQGRKVKARRDGTRTRQAKRRSQWLKSCREWKKHYRS